MIILSLIPVRDRCKRVTTSLFEVGVVFGVYCLREWLLGTISRHTFRNIFFLLFALFLDLVRDADHCDFVRGRNLIYNCLGERCQEWLGLLSWWLLLPRRGRIIGLQLIQQLLQIVILLLLLWTGRLGLRLLDEGWFNLVQVKFGY